MMEQVASKQLKYTPEPVSEPTYQYQRVLPNSGGTTTNTTATGGISSYFEIAPGKAFNLARSWFQFTFLTGLPTTNTNFEYCFHDFHPWFQNIQVYTRGGQFLMDLTDAHVFSKMTMKYNKPLEVLMNDQNINAAGTAGAVATPDIFSTPCCIQGNATVSANYRYDGSASSINYLEPQYLMQSSAVNTSMQINVCVRFRDWVDTVLALDKDLFFNETIVVRFVWNMSPKIIFAAPPNNPQGTSEAVPFTNIANNITNMEIRLAVEQNLDIQRMLEMRVNSPEGMSVLFDYAYNVITNIAAGTQQIVTLKMNRAQGLRLRKIYYSIFGTTGALNTQCYENSNIVTAGVGSKISRFYSMLNNTRLMPFDYDITVLDDWHAQAYLLKNSCVLSPNEFQYNWMWIEDFEKRYGQEVESGVTDNLLSGLELINQDSIYVFFGTVVVSANYNHYSYPIIKRKMIIQGNQLVVV